MISNLIKRSFEAAGEEFGARGGLFGADGFHAQAFCNNVVGQSPAASAVAKGFGKFVAVATLAADQVKAAAKHTAHLTGGNSFQTLCP